jgi:excisionase family DNA binding protein
MHSANWNENNISSNPAPAPPRLESTGIPMHSREWLGLRELSVYANVSERTLRSWIRAPRDPLPATKVRGKILVRRSDFDRFLERHQVQPLAAIDVDRIVEEVLGQRR